MNVPKTRIQIFLDPSIMDLVVEYGRMRNKRTISETITGILYEWQRMKRTVQQLEIVKRDQDVLKAKVIKK